MTLRLATPQDIDALADLGRRAFIAKFGHLYSAENLNLFLDDTHVPAKVAKELADPDMTVAVIEQDGEIAAFCKVLRTSSMPKLSDAMAPFELKQLYTDPDRLSQGMGGKLMTWALEQARAAGADELQLSVYADNPDAHRFYARYGLAKLADITFKVGDHIDPEIMMTVKL